MSFCVSRMHSASREIGTQTSVAHMPQPGLAALAAHAASWRACHILLRSSAWPVQAKSPPPFSAASACTISACSLALASVPWNSSISVLFRGRLSLEYLFTVSTVAVSISSMRATGMPDWMVWITVLTAPSSESKAQVAETIDSGMP